MISCQLTRYPSIVCACFFFFLPFLETTPTCRPAYPTATSGPTKPNQEPAPSFPPAQFVDPTPRPTFVTGPSFAPFQPTPEFVPSSFTQPPIPRPSYAPVDAFQPQTAVPIADSVAAPQFVPGASITMEDLIFGESPPTSSRTDPNAPLPTPQAPPEYYNSRGGRTPPSPAPK